ncbi:MAG: L,D-transpeptidase [Eubacteriales bacterium]|nr:L,D-transpeptidase [Eubacteriales bacterium]MDD4390526.1 L,D-transpeptidase [Eubacteriales bacterium]
MKSPKYILATLLLAIFMLFFLIACSEREETGAEVIGGNEEHVGVNVATQEPIFDLQYEKYLIEPPYTYEANGETRTFRFKLMLEYIAKADKAFGEGLICYVDNYKNRNGLAPHHDGKNEDEYGVDRSASAPAYLYEDNLDSFRYIEDGNLLIVDEDKDGFAKARLVGDESGRYYYIPSRYVPTSDSLTALVKAIVIDKTNQNITAFEVEDGIWRIVSYSLATTGKEGQYHKATPTGFFYAIEKKEKFYYLKDGTDDFIEGYAPYAIRFTQGAYIHGVATDFNYHEDGGRTDPGIREFSSTIGTVPLSHKCVRNYTSHAKFLYDWYNHGNTVVIVIE